MRSTYFWIAVAVVIAIGGFLLLANRQQTTQPGETGIGGGPGVITEQKEIEVQLNPIDKDQFDQSGKATLEEKDGKVTVILNLDKVEQLNNQPAHIHIGSCPGVGEVLFPLNNVVDGSSVTEISTTIDQLKTSQNPLAINVHKSDQEINIYTSCGELPK